MSAPRTTSFFAGFRFPREVISVAVRWYLRYGLSYRDAEELLAERGVTVDHVTDYRWVQRFTPEFIETARPYRHAPGNRWFVDETCLKVAGNWTYLYRAVDQHGQVIDVLLLARRDLAAARRQLGSGYAAPGVAEVGDHLQFPAERADVVAEGGEFGHGAALDGGDSLLGHSHRLCDLGLGQAGLLAHLDQVLGPDLHLRRQS